MSVSCAWSYYIIIIGWGVIDSINSIKVEVFIGWGVAVNIKVEVVSILVGWVAVALVYYYFFKVLFVIYTLINLDSVSPYLLLAN